MKEVQITSRYILREDGILLNVKTGKRVVLKKSSMWKGFRIHIGENHKTIHFLVLTNFGPKCPGEGYLAGHINGDEYDNRIENLKWMTLSEISRRRKDALPEGQRRCDFNTQAEYAASNTRRYNKKYKNKHYLENHEKAAVISRIKYNSDDERKKRHHKACKMYAIKNREKINAYQRKWREKNKDVINTKRRSKDRSNEYESTKKWRRNNKEKYNAYQQKWVANHYGEIKEYNAIYRLKNKDKFKQYKIKSKKQ